jgi:capsular polysaccharide biosynthesis protein
MKRPLLIIGTLLALALITIPAVFFYLDWRIPRATATVQIHPSIIAISHGKNSDGTPHNMTRWFIESPTEKFLSAETLKLVIQKTDLFPNLDQGIRYLKKVTTAVPRKGTDFIDITVKHQPKEQAILLANTIAQVAAEHQKETEINRAGRALEALDEELDHQEILVADHRKVLETLMAQYKLPFPSNEKPFPTSKEIPSEPNADTVDLSLRQHTYTQALDSFQQSQAMLREMKIKQNESRTLLKTPRDPITIHQRAEWLLAWFL